jgi:hypothetical protein
MIIDASLANGIKLIVIFAGFASLQNVKKLSHFMYKKTNT